MKYTLSISLALLPFLIVLAPPLSADGNNVKNAYSRLVPAAFKQTKFTPAQNSTPYRIPDQQDELVLSAPPWESPERGAQLYRPVAEYLSQVIGRKIVYKHPGTWGVYRSEMQNGNYDLLFDGPHYNSYRTEKLGHNILVKIPGRQEFVFFVRNEPNGYTNLPQMAGHTFCTQAPPNLGTLVLLDQFDNPTRQPALISIDRGENIYKGVVSGRCDAGVLPVANLKNLDQNKKTRVIYITQALPSQAFSAGPRLTPAEQTRIAQALISPTAAAPTEKLRAIYHVDQGFALATNQEYQGMSAYLKNEWGFY